MKLLNKKKKQRTSTYNIKGCVFLILGYIRVSTVQQNTDRQFDALTEYGCEKLFIDKITGKKADRPELNKLLEQLRKDDVIVVTELSRFGRSTKDLIFLIEKIKSSGAEFKSLKESFIDTTTPSGYLIFNIFSAIAEFERVLIVERTKEGLASARARGRKGGRPSVNTVSLEKALNLYRSKQYSLSEIKEMTGVSKTTLYKYLSPTK